MPHVRPCRHLFTDGHQCGSPALRGEPLCFNHHSARRPLQHQTIHGRTQVALPEPLDLHAIQRGLAELLRLTAADAIDLKLATALHRQLSTASQNLARIERSEARADARAQALNLHRAPVTDYTNHPTLGTLALEFQPAPQPATSPQTSLQTSPQAPPDLQTYLQPNQDLETWLANTAEGPRRTPSPADAPRPAPETRASGGPTAPATPGDLQTQPSSNQDLETPLPNRANIPEDPIEAQTPLPDPVHRFTLPPVIENIQTREELANAERVYAQALETLAKGIHTRAQTRAKLHSELYPLVDDTLADERVLDLYPQLHPILLQLNRNEGTTP